MKDVQLMSKQKVFDRAARHLLKQGKPARDLLGNCQYRMRDPETGRILKCAVGAFITKARYHADLEGNDCAKSSVIAALGPGPRDFEVVDLLKEIQMIHDGVMPGPLWVEQVRDRLGVLAARRGLNPDVLG